MNGINYSQLAAFEAKGEPFVTVTVVDKKGHAPAAVQTAMIVSADGTTTGTIGGGAIEYRAVKIALKQLQLEKPLLQNFLLEPEKELKPEKGNKKTGEATGMVCGGEVTLFFAPHTNRKHCIICGAGHISRALAALLLPLGYRLTVVDSRQSFIDDFPVNAQMISANPAEYIKEMKLTSGTAIIIATHSHELDYRCLAAVISAPVQPGYCGVLASSRKSERFRKRLTDEYQNPALNIVHMPCGVQTGGTLPVDIALSIAAQLQQWRNNLL